MITSGALLLAARAYENQRERPEGSNWGEEDGVVRKSLAAVRIAKSAAWCAGFACLCVLEAHLGARLTESEVWLHVHAENYPKGFRPSARALGLWELNPRLRVDKAECPSPEDLAIYDHGGGKGHVDIVESSMILSSRPGAFHFWTLGGNTNKGGGRTGVGVFGSIFRSSDDPQLKGFLRLSKLALA
jgi:hypothetical protein